MPSLPIPFSRYLIFTALLLISICAVEPLAAQRTPDASLIDAQLALQKDPMAVKIAPELLLLHDLHMAHLAEGKGPFVNPVASATVKSHMVRIEAVSTEASAANLIGDLRAIGMTNPTSYKHALNGWLPISSIRQMASLDRLRFVHQAYQPIYASGIVTSQGDTAQNSHLARMNFTDAMGMPIDGSGIRVCVISDSYDDLGGAADDIASGDLPAEGVINLDSTVNGDRSDEGRAMLQIVHDVAPGAELMFHTADGGIPTLAAHIEQLVDSGCTVIVDDVVYPNDAMFMDGLVAQAVDEAALAGITYLTAAGNAGRRSYQSAYRPATGHDTTISFVTYRPHDFDPGPGVDIYQTIKVKPGATLRLSLNWDDPWYSITGGAATDTDVNIFLYKQMNGSPQIPLALGNIVNNNPPSGNGPWGNAWEVITWQNTLGTLDSIFNIFIGWDIDFGGPQPNIIKWIDSGSASNSVIDHPTFSSTVFGQQNAAEGLSVAAASWWETPAYDSMNPPQLALYSSAGGTPILLDGQGNSMAPVYRNKPNFTAPTGGNNTFFSSDLPVDSDTFPNFQGTSAAAPHAAGVAALIKQMQPLFTPDDIKATMQNTAIDMGDTTGFDFDSGYGLINANSSLTSLPVRLLDLKVRRQGNRAVLTWRTAGEINNRGFEIQMARDVGNLRAVSWQNMGWVDGNGTSAAEHTYTYSIHDLDPGTYYFRLKQVDLDARFRLSDVRSLSIEDELLQSSVFYDTGSQNVVLKWNAGSDSDVRIGLYDMSGRMLAQSTGSLADGRMDVPFAGYPRAVYAYRVQFGTAIVSGKVVNR